MIASLAGVLVGLAGCTPSSQPPPGPSVSAPDGTPSLGTAPPPASESPDDVVAYEVTYGFAVPTSTVTITNTSPQRAYLVGVYVGDHRGEGDPRFQRISFYFRGGFPSYRFGYVPQITQDGSGDPVVLEGTYFLSVVFDDAQAHDDATGASTVVKAPDRPLGFSRLLDYASAGDFEGQVSYGLGVAASRDGRPLILTGELTRADRAGGFFYVVHVDVHAEF
jgi:hypothetical protein